MSRVSIRFTWLAFACVTAFAALSLLTGPSAAQAGETVWICKPGQADDLCAGTIAGKTMPAPSRELTYTRPENPPVDCFYLYPTQSEQSTPNSDLSKDPPIRRVVVQQARMFSSVCRMFAPMYRQVTFSGDQTHDSPDVEVAFASARAGFRDYLRNYNRGRGFIMIGHSQGAAHTARLIDEMVDTNRGLRRRFIGAITPGANIPVPIGRNVGGMFAKIPACSRPGQFGCVTAYSMYNGDPGTSPQFSNLETGYWIYPFERPDPDRFEVICADPSKLSGSPGHLTPLLNNDYLLSVPATESPAPWRAYPDQVTASCEREGGAHWLNVDFTPEADPFLATMVAQVASGNNYHVPEVNLAEGNLLEIAGDQASAWLRNEARRRSLAKRRDALSGKLKRLKRQSVKTRRQCRAAKRRARSDRGSCRRSRKLRVQVRKTRRKLARVERQIRQLG